MTSIQSIYPSSAISQDLLALVPDDSSVDKQKPPHRTNSAGSLIWNSDRDRVAITISATNVNQLTPLLENQGFEIINASPQHHLIQGWIDPSSITKLESLSDAGFLGALPVYQPIANVGDVTSQADGIHQTDRVRQELNFDGNGVTVGIMSDSFNNLGGAAAGVASGDLPAGIRVLQDLPDGGTDEGRAMAELVHDLAPGADISFSSVAFGELDFAQQIRDLADPNLGNGDVLVDDIAYLTEPFFQDGVIAQAIDEVVENRDVTYFSAAGNSADQAYESTDFAVANDSESFFVDLFHDFDPSEGIDTRQNITVNANSTIDLVLQWDDPFYTSGGVDTNLDIFLLEAGTNNVVAGSAFDNITAQIPVEIFSFTNFSESPQNYDVVITLTEGATPGRIKYLNFGSDITFNEFDTDSPTIVGHPAATNAQAIGAARFTTPNQPEFFTSLGPTTILFEPNGTFKAAPEVRQTPDLTAIDGTDNTFFGFDFDGNGFPNFFGTSAAAPHTAAIAALIQEANPDLSPQEVYDVLADTAIDIGASGFDNLTGAGLIDAFAAVNAVAPNTGTGENLIGTNRNDLIEGGAGDDTISGANGSDTLNGNDGDDLIFGGNRKDSLSGGNGNDTLFGEQGSDTLFGDDGNDILNGGDRKDIINGGQGNDLIVGGRGKDILTGSQGADIFVYETIVQGRDRITDFDVVEDRIDLDSILDGANYDSATPFVDYVELVQLGSDTLVKVDPNGDAPSGRNRSLVTLEATIVDNLTEDNFIFS